MNPFLSNVPLHPKRDVAILAREDVVIDTYKRIRAGEFCLILGPRYGGRTTLLRAVKNRLQESPGELPVLVQPEELDLTDERLFLESLAILVREALQGAKAWPKSLELTNYAIGKRADGFNGFLDNLARLLDYRLIFLFDSIEDIPPHLLVRIASIAHSIFSQRESKSFFKTLSFNFAGAISLRYLTFSLKPEVSPFNVCSSVPLRDLSVIQARTFLERIIEKFGLSFRSDGISTILEFVSGDLNMLQRVAGLALDANGSAGGVDKATVTEIVETVVQTDPWHTEEGLTETAKLVEEDSQVLDLVLGLLAQKKGNYQPSEVDKTLYGRFDMTYPEMTGAVLLKRTDGTPTEWSFRNKITELFLRRHFTPQRITKTYLELGQFEAAVESCDPLLDHIRAQVENDVVHFNDTELKEVLQVFISRIRAEHSHESGYELLARLLNRGFGCPEVTYFEYIEPKQQLVAVPFLSALFKNDGTEYSVAAQQHAEVLEVQAFRMQLFKTDASNNDLHIAIPLKNLVGDVTAVVTIHAQKDNGWANLDLKIRVIKNALQAINIALTTLESHRKNEMIHSLRPPGGKGASKIFVAHAFSQELLKNLRDYLGRVSAELVFVYVDDTKPLGLVSEAILAVMRGCRLCLYEMSVPNHNVYFECGLGLGLNLPGFLFVRVRKAPAKPPRIPPVLDGILYFDYFNYTSIMEDIAGKLNCALDSYWENQGDHDFIHFLGAKLPELSKRISYAAILDHDHFGDQADYRKVMDEAFKEIGLETAYPLDEHVAVGRYLSEAAHGSMPRLLNLMSLLRNANMIVSRVENIKGSTNSHVIGQSFIGLGFAFGLNEVLRPKGIKIYMTLLNQDERGKRLDVPGDLKGYPFLRYKSLPELKSILKDTLTIKK